MTFLKSMFFGSIHQKDLSKNEVSKHLKQSLLQANKLVIPLQKHGDKDGPVLSFATK